MLVPPESSSAVLVMIRSKSVSICNHSRARLVDSSRNRTFSRGYPNLMRSYGGLIEPRGSHLTPLKSTFKLNAEHFVAGCPGLSSMVSGAIHAQSVYCSSKSLKKFTKNPYFGGSRSFKVIDVGTNGTLVGSACYDTQQVCVYLQPFSR